MNNRLKALIALAITLSAFALGRYSNRPSAPAVHTIEDVKTDTETKVNKDTHKVTTITKKPTGEETTTITEDTVTNADRTKESASHIDQTITPPKASRLNLSVLAGVDPTNAFKPVYGVSANKELIGPFTVGVWGLTNSNFGVSVGLNF